VALTHDVDSPWRWTRVGVRGAASRIKQSVLHARVSPAVREATGLAIAPWHRLCGTDPNWRFEQIAGEERRRGATGSTFFVPAGQNDPPAGAARQPYAELRRKLVETIRTAGGEIGLPGSYTAADDPSRLA